MPMFNFQANPHNALFLFKFLRFDLIWIFISKRCKKNDARFNFIVLFFNIGPCYNQDVFKDYMRIYRDG